jgi:putative transposase
VTKRVSCACRARRPPAVSCTLTAGAGRSEHPVVTLSFLYRAFCRVLQLIRLTGRRDIDLAIEVVVLRHEVAVLRRQVHRPALEPADRAVLAGLARLLPRQRLGHLFVQPSTLLRWHRDVVAKRWTYPHGRPGRPALSNGTTALVLRLAKDNPQWGYRRIHGELATMGIVIAASSVWAILKRHGIEPSPRRSGPTWTEFLATQAKGLMACDFFHVDTILLHRLYVLVFIHHDSRLVRIAGVTAKPVADWVTQQARNLSMNLADQTNPVKFLIRDRDTKYTASFDAVFAADAVKVVRTPVQAPRANAICERVIGTIRRECLDRMLIVGRVTSKQSLPSTSSITTRTGPTGPSANDRPLTLKRPLPPSATLTPPGYEEPTVWAVSSTSTEWSPELGGRGSRHPQARSQLASVRDVADFDLRRAVVAVLPGDLAASAW